MTGSEVEGFDLRIQDLKYRQSKTQNRCRLILAALAAIVAFGCSTAIWAQSCPMCYRAAAAKSGAIHALRSGILILMIPPVLIVGGISILAVRGRNRFNDASDSDSVPESIDGRDLSEWLEPLPHREAGRRLSGRSERGSSAA